ncbi:Ca(2+)-dependent cysteine protease MCA1 KNAG_0A03330 [Huiozyma naganishii CBS 8797]|uniref:Metacaspase-1 n=1 Tax=Huiozyma naganishii (strain ATCC MYA-139 / BCRC 22969 / CBS 8797 / KCTC 17520 / NBRC 10181 / NCYC 3082 / Yp74L-3) TaxID=1071383 RepID=J7S285_HUIN7|nr:hypothetical protein KNAG_0A03330 [Kazachstania naganishii CBS 8797]CCK68019.1 hypothetical protein KNAG_0A03330 [Kazachstania naganishii CBS 8797]
MFPGNGRYTYGQNSNQGYQRPGAPPPPGGYYGNNGGSSYSRPQGNSPSGYRQGGYDRPSAPPPISQNNPPQSMNPEYSGAPGGYAQPSYLQAPPQATQSFNVQDSNQAYSYSQCTGQRKALIIGINYIGSKNQLRGCINDAHNIFDFLTSRYGYSRDDIVMLTDDQQNMVCVPTRANMIRAMNWLVKDARPNDSLFFHYSGHGGLTKDLDGDEESGFDSVIYPVDFESAGQIIDDEMHDIMVRPLSQGVRLTALFDSCHSGSVLDLPYTYSTKGVVKEPNMWKNVGSGGLQAAMAYASGNRTALFSSLGSIASTVKGSVGNNVDRDRVRQIKFSQADVIMFSGSKDDQTSADAVEDGKNIGAMSWAFIRALSNQPQQSYLSLLQNMRQELITKYSQKPQLSASHPIDVNLQFIF